jgi:phospholipid-binding lipoprotein MlaA
MRDATVNDNARTRFAHTNERIIMKGARSHACARGLALAMIIMTVDAALLCIPARAAEPLEEVVVQDTKLTLEEADTEDYDPWESFNEKMFNFNYKLDKYVIKPVARVYNEIVLPGERQAIHNAYDNVAMPRRFINSLLQGKFKGASREIARFVINSTLGVAGLADVAKYQFNLEKSDEDTGQTFGHYGSGPGPYLILPFTSPLTVRDAIGWAFDIAMDPLTYILPALGSVGKKTEDVINERALNIENFEDVEEATLDLYGAVRNSYLTRRKQQIAE